MGDEIKPEVVVNVTPEVEIKPEGVTPEKFAELQGTLKEIREKFAGRETETEAIKKELEGLKGTTQVVDRLKRVLGGQEDQGTLDQQRKKAEFYKLLVDDPVEAIRQVVGSERAKVESKEREMRTEKDFTKFTKLYPEYKEFEEDMKAEMLSNPGWFDKPNFIKRVFFDVLQEKNPELLKKLLDENRGSGRSNEPDFLYEGATQTIHGSSEDAGKEIMTRMRNVVPEKNYFT
jgi:hypothetical protein